MKVLVIEDDASALELLAVRLEALSCELLVAQSVERALTLAAEEQPGLIIVDLRLFGNDHGGLKVIEALRTHEPTAHLPVVVHSIFVRRMSDDLELSEKVDGVLPKPFKYLDLKQIIEDARSSRSHR